MSEFEVDFTVIKQPTRLGKRAATQEEQAKLRLLRVTLGNASTKKQALQKAKGLRTSQYSQMVGVKCTSHSNQT